LSNPEVKYGTDQKELSYSVKATYSTIYGKRLRYCAILDNLSDGTRYFYTIPESDKLYSFKTLSKDSSTFRFAVIGDSRTGIATHRQLINLMKQYDFSFYFNTGDLVEHNRLEEWDFEFFHIEEPLLSSRFFNPVEGNHDTGDEGITLSKLFYFPDPVTPSGSYYSFWVKNNIFIVVSTEEPFTPGSFQYKWLESQLKEAEERHAYHKFMFFHRPPYSSGVHGGTEDRGMKLAREYLAPLAITYGVTIVFNGHEHCYERSYKDGVYFITTGGGGAPPAFLTFPSNPYSQFYEPNGDLEHFHFLLIEVGETYVDLKAITINNEVMDHLLIGEKFEFGPPHIPRNCRVTRRWWGFGCTEGEGGSIGEILFLSLLIGIYSLMYRKSKA